MPLYEYQCQACGHRFTMLVKMAEKDEQRSCPECKEEQCKRMLSSFAMGSGGGGYSPPSSSSGGGFS